MASAPDKILALRELLAQRFPQASATVRGRCVATGIPAIDEVSGGLPIGAVTEIVSSAPSSGSMLLLARIFAVCRAQCLRVALIDGDNSFDPQSFTPDELSHLVWIRCRDLKQVMQVADLVARDANFGLVVIDLRRQTERELRREPPTGWYRLQRAAEQNDLPLLIATPCAIIPSALVRFGLNQSFHLTDLDEPRRLLAKDLALELHRQRRQIEQEAV
jgi:RecA/RadA recombinase